LLTLHWFVQITRHVQPGSIVMTDEWRGYNGMDTWTNPPYVHMTVNHSKHFVDPVTGANTQRIESCWRDFKLRLVKSMHKTRQKHALDGYCAEEWWHSVHRRTPFMDIVAEICRQYPL